ncbi:MAG: hypothetical protein ACK4VI_02065 [Alphaproteobacteria bacterium]
MDSARPSKAIVGNTLIVGAACPAATAARAALPPVNETAANAVVPMAVHFVADHA